MSGIHQLYTDYFRAERDCDEIAGDNEFHMAVVECFDLEGPNDKHAPKVLSAVA